MSPQSTVSKSLARVPIAPDRSYHVEPLHVGLASNGTHSGGPGLVQLIFTSKII